VIRTPSLSRYLLTPPWATHPGQVRDLLDDAAAVAALIVPPGAPRGLAWERARPRGDRGAVHPRARAGEVQ